MKIVILLSLVFNANFAYSSQFLEKSELLMKNKIKIFIGDIVENKISIDNPSIKKTTNLYIVDGSGIKKTKYIGDGGIQNCRGGSIQAPSFVLTNNSAPLLILSSNKSIKFKWTKAEKIKSHKCSNLITDKNTIYKTSLKDPEIIIRSIHQKRLTAKETREDCKTDEMCLEMSKTKDRDILNIGYSNNCLIKNVVQKIRDVDGKEYGQNAIDELLGTLEITDSSVKEEWLIFDAPGYEGDGILGVQKENFMKSDFSKIDWVVYNGC